MRLICMLWLVCLGCFAQKKKTVKPVVHMVQPGSFQIGDVKVVSGGGWIGLAPSRNGFEWAQYRIVVREGRTIEVDGGEPPLFLLKGMPWLAKRSVHTCFDRSETGSLVEQNPILLTCEARAYRVEVKNGRRDLQFEHAGKSQTLYRWPMGLVDQRAELVWAGDLDGDSHLDLLFDHALSNNSTGLTLYLSSLAGPGKLVGTAASFMARRIE